MDNIPMFFSGNTQKLVQRWVTGYHEVALKTGRSDVWYRRDQQGLPDYQHVVFDVDPAEELWELLRAKYAHSSTKAEAEWHDFKVGDKESPDATMDRLEVLRDEVPAWTEAEACEKWLKALGPKAAMIPQPRFGCHWDLAQLCTEVHAFNRRLSGTGSPGPSGAGLTGGESSLLEHPNPADAEQRRKLPPFLPVDGVIDAPLFSARQVIDGCGQRGTTLVHQAAAALQRCADSLDARTLPVH
eukprot:jgi/Mesvir1/26526/Mv16181-RA.1